MKGKEIFNNLTEKWTGVYANELDNNFIISFYHLWKKIDSYILNGLESNENIQDIIKENNFIFIIRKDNIIIYDKEEDNINYVNYDRSLYNNDLLQNIFHNIKLYKNENNDLIWILEITCENSTIKWFFDNTDCYSNNMIWFTFEDKMNHYLIKKKNLDIDYHINVLKYQLYTSSDYCPDFLYINEILYYRFKNRLINIMEDIAFIEKAFYSILSKYSGSKIVKFTPISIKKEFIMIFKEWNKDNYYISYINGNIKNYWINKISTKIREVIYDYWKKSYETLLSNDEYSYASPKIYETITINNLEIDNLETHSLKYNIVDNNYKFKTHFENKEYKFSTQEELNNILIKIIKYVGELFYPVSYKDKMIELQRYIVKNEKQTDLFLWGNINLDVIYIYDKQTKKYFIVVIDEILQGSLEIELSIFNNVYIPDINKIRYLTEWILLDQNNIIHSVLTNDESFFVYPFNIVVDDWEANLFYRNDVFFEIKVFYMENGYTNLFISYNEYEKGVDDNIYVNKLLIITLDEKKEVINHSEKIFRQKGVLKHLWLEKLLGVKKETSFFWKDKYLLSHNNKKYDRIFLVEKIFTPEKIIKGYNINNSNEYITNDKEEIKIAKENNKILIDIDDSDFTIIKLD